MNNLQSRISRLLELKKLREVSPTDSYDLNNGRYLLFLGELISDLMDSGCLVFSFEKEKLEKVSINRKNGETSNYYTPIDLSLSSVINGHVLSELIPKTEYDDKFFLVFCGGKPVLLCEQIEEAYWRKWKTHKL